MEISLCQYYDLESKKLGYRSWNHLCAQMQIPAVMSLKKKLKREYRTQKGTLTEKEKKQC